MQSPVLVDYSFFRHTHRTVRFKHFGYLFLIIFSIVAISMVAVFYSLGYQINWQNFTIRQTGILFLDSKVERDNVSVLINGQTQSQVLPYRYIQVFPGEYTVQIKKDQYQTWTRIITIEPNKVVSYKDVLLILKKPLVTTTTEEDRALFNNLDTNDIEIRQNELWINGQFVTRFSEDIKTAAWYPDHQHVVYQVGTRLILVDIDGFSTQTLVQLPSDVRTDFGFRDGGRILVYSQDGHLNALQLY